MFYLFYDNVRSSLLIIMSNIYIYIPIYLVTLIAIVYAYYTGRNHFAFSLVIFFILISFSFLGSYITIKKKQTINKKEKRMIISLWASSTAIIIISFFFRCILLGCLISFLLVCLSLYNIKTPNKNQ